MAVSVACRIGRLRLRSRPAWPMSALVRWALRGIGRHWPALGDRFASWFALCRCNSGVPVGVGGSVRRSVTVAGGTPGRAPQLRLAARGCTADQRRHHANTSTPITPQPQAGSRAPHRGPRPHRRPPGPPPCSAWRKSRAHPADAVTAAVAWPAGWPLPPTG